MFSRAIAYFYFLFALTVLAAAMPGGQPPSTTTRTITVTQTASGPEPTSSCTTGPIQCCQSIQSVRATPRFALMQSFLLTACLSHYHSRLITMRP